MLQQNMTPVLHEKKALEGVEYPVDLCPELQFARERDFLLP
jgi:hypothetical protein